MAQPVIRFRVDFAKHCSVGPGKVDLLEAIGRVGSLSHAARELNMSYRYAWLLLDNLNRSFRVPVTTASVGGKGGGGVVLTALGQQLIKGYRDFAREFEASSARHFESFADLTVRLPPKKAIRRQLPRSAARGPTARRTKLSL